MKSIGIIPLQNSCVVVYLCQSSCVVVYLCLICRGLPLYTIYCSPSNGCLAITLHAYSNLGSIVNHDVIYVCLEDFQDIASPPRNENGVTCRF